MGLPYMGVAGGPMRPSNDSDKLSEVYHEKSFILPDVSRVLACLYEKDVKFETHIASYKSLLRLQASSHAPVPFYDGPTFLEESREICRYIAQKYEHQGYPFLLGKDALERASIEQWLHNEEHAFNPPSRALFCHLAFPLGDEEDDDIDIHTRKLEEVLEVYEQRLSDSEFLVGNKFTLADLVHLPNSHYIKASNKFLYLYDSRKNVRRWWDAISDRDSWKKVLRYMKWVEEQNKQEELKKQQKQEEDPRTSADSSRLDPRKQIRTEPRTILVPPTDTRSSSSIVPRTKKRLPGYTSPDELLISSSHSIPADKTSAVQSKETTIFTNPQETPPTSVQSTPVASKTHTIPVQSTKHATSPATAKKLPITDAVKSSTKDDSILESSSSKDVSSDLDVFDHYPSHTDVDTPFIEPTIRKTSETLDAFPGSNIGTDSTKTSSISAREEPDQPAASDFDKSDSTGTSVDSRFKEPVPYSGRTPPELEPTDTSASKLHTMDVHRRQVEQWHSAKTGLNDLKHDDADHLVSTQQGKPRKDLQQYPSQVSEQTTSHSVPQEPMSPDVLSQLEDYASSDQRGALLPPSTQHGVTPSRQVAAKDARRRISSQTAYPGGQDTSKQPRDHESVPRQGEPQDAREIFDESKAPDSTISSERFPYTSQLSVPRQDLDGARHATAPFETRYPGAEDTSKQAKDKISTPWQMTDHDAGDVNEETKVSESSSFQVQPSYFERADAPSRKQETIDDTFKETRYHSVVPSSQTRYQTPPSKARYPTAEDASQQPRGTAPTHKKKAAQDDNDTSEESKTADEVASTEQPLDAWRSPVSPRRQKVEDSSRSDTSFQKRYPYDEEDIQVANTAVSWQIAPDGDKNIFEETKLPDSTPTSAKPMYTPQTPFPPPRQAEVKDAKDKGRQSRVTIPESQKMVSGDAQTTHGERKTGTPGEQSSDRLQAIPQSRPPAAKDLSTREEITNEQTVVPPLLSNEPTSRVQPASEYLQEVASRGGFSTKPSTIEKWQRATVPLNDITSSSGDGDIGAETPGVQSASPSFPGASTARHATSDDKMLPTPYSAPVHTKRETPDGHEIVDSELVSTPHRHISEAAKIRQDQATVHEDVHGANLSAHDVAKDTFKEAKVAESTPSSAKPMYSQQPAPTPRHAEVEDTWDKRMKGREPVPERQQMLEKWEGTAREQVSDSWKASAPSRQAAAEDVRGATGDTIQSPDVLDTSKKSRGAYEEAKGPGFVKEEKTSTYQKKPLVAQDSQKQAQTIPAGEKADGSIRKHQQASDAPNTFVEKLNASEPARVKTHGDFSAEQPYRKDTTDDQKVAPPLSTRELTSHIQPPSEPSYDAALHRDLSSKPSIINQWQRSSAPLHGVTSSSGDDEVAKSTVDEKPTPVSQQKSDEQRVEPPVPIEAEISGVQHASPSFSGASVDDRATIGDKFAKRSIIDERVGEPTQTQTSSEPTKTETKVAHSIPSSAQPMHIQQPALTPSRQTQVEEARDKSIQSRETIPEQQKMVERKRGISGEQLSDRQKEIRPSRQPLPEDATMQSPDILDTPKKSRATFEESIGPGSTLPKAQGLDAQDSQLTKGESTVPTTDQRKDWKYAKDDESIITEENSLSTKRLRGMFQESASTAPETQHTDSEGSNALEKTSSVYHKGPLAAKDIPEEAQAIPADEKVDSYASEHHESFGDPYTDHEKLNVPAPARADTHDDHSAEEQYKKYTADDQKVAPSLSSKEPASQVQPASEPLQRAIVDGDLPSKSFTIDQWQRTAAPLDGVITDSGDDGTAMSSNNDQKSRSMSQDATPSSQSVNQMGKQSGEQKVEPPVPIVAEASDVGRAAPSLPEAARADVATISDKFTEQSNIDERMGKPKQMQAPITAAHPASARTMRTPDSHEAGELFRTPEGQRLEAAKATRDPATIHEDVYDASLPTHDAAIDEKTATDHANGDEVVTGSLHDQQAQQPASIKAQPTVGDSGKAELAKPTVTDQEATVPAAGPTSADPKRADIVPAGVAHSDQKSTLSDKGSARAAQHPSPVEPIKADSNVSAANYTNAPQKIFRQQARPPAPSTIGIRTSDTQGVIGKIQEVTPDNRGTEDFEKPFVPNQEHVSHTSEAIPDQEEMTSPQGARVFPMSDTQLSSADVHEVTPDDQQTVESITPLVSSGKQSSHVRSPFKPGEVGPAEIVFAPSDEESPHSSEEKISGERRKEQTVIPTAEQTMAQPTIIGRQDIPDRKQPLTSEDTLNNTATHDDVHRIGTIEPARRPLSIEGEESVPDTQKGIPQGKAIPDQEPAHTTERPSSTEPRKEEANAASGDQPNVTQGRETTVRHQDKVSPSDSREALQKYQQPSHAVLPSDIRDRPTPGVSSVVDKETTQTSVNEPNSTPTRGDVVHTRSVQNQEAQPPPATQAPTSQVLQETAFSQNDSPENIKSPRQPTTDQTVVPASPTAALLRTEPGPYSSRSIQTPFSTETTIEDNIVTAADQTEDMQTITHQQAITPAPGTAKPPFPGAQDASRKFQGSTTDDGLVEDYSPNRAAHTQPPAATLDVSPPYASSKAKSTGQEAKPPTGYQASTPETQLGSSQTQGEATPAEKKFAISDEKSADASKPFASAEPTEEDTDAAPADQTSVPPTNVTRQVARSTPDASDALSRDQESSPDAGQIRNLESPLIASQEEASRAGRASEGSTPKEHSAIVEEKRTLPPRQAQTSSTGPDLAQIGGVSRLSGAGMPAASSMEKQEAEPPAATQEPTSKGLQDSGNIESPRQASTDQTVTPAMSSAAPSVGPEGTEPGPNSSRSIQTPFSTEPTKEDTIVTAADQREGMETITHQQAITPASDRAKPPFPGAQDASTKFQGSTTDDALVEDYSPKRAAQTQPPAATLHVSPPYASSKAKSTGQGAEPPTGYQASSPETQLGSSQTQGKATPAEQKFAISDEKSADASKPFASAEPTEEDTDAAPADQTSVPPTNVTRQVARSTPDASDALSRDQESSPDYGQIRNLESPLIASQEEASRAGRASEGSTPKEHSTIVDQKRTLPPRQAQTSSTGPDSAQISGDSRLSGARMPAASSMENQEAEPPAATQEPTSKGPQVSGNIESPRQASTDQTLTPAMTSAAPSDGLEGTEPGPNSFRSVQTRFSTEPTKEDTIVTTEDQAEDMQTITHQQAITPAPDTAKPPFPGAQDASTKFQESIADDGRVEDYSPKRATQTQPPAATLDVSPPYASSKAKSTEQGAEPPTGYQASSPETQLGSSQTQGEAALAEQKFAVSDEKSADASKPFASAERTEEDTDAATADDTIVPPTNVTRQVARSTPDSSDALSRDQESSPDDGQIRNLESPLIASQEEASRAGHASEGSTPKEHSAIVDQKRTLSPRQAQTSSTGPDSAQIGGDSRLSGAGMPDASSMEKQEAEPPAATQKPTSKGLQDSGNIESPRQASTDQTSVPPTNVTRHVARSTPDASDALSRDQESSPDDGQIRNLESPLIASQEEASRAGRASDGSTPKEHSAVVEEKRTLPPRQAQTSSTGPDSAQTGGDSRLSGASIPAASSLEKPEAEPPAATQEPTSKGLQDSGNIESPRQASTDQTVTPAMSSAAPSDGPEGTEPGPNSSQSIQTPFSTEPTKEDTIVTAADQGEFMETITHQQAITPALDTAKPPFPGAQDASRKFQGSTTDDGLVEDYSPKRTAQTQPPAATLDVSPPYASSKAKSTGQGAKPPTGYQASSLETQLRSSQTQGEAAPAEQKFDVSDEKSADAPKPFASAEPKEDDTDAAPADQTSVPPTNVTRQVPISTPDASDALSRDQESSPDNGQIRNLESPLIASQEASRAGRASEGSTPKEHSAIVDQKRTLPPRQAQTSSTGPDSAQISGDSSLSGAGMPAASSTENQEAEPPAATQELTSKGPQDSRNIESPRQASTDQTVAPAMTSATPSDGPEGTEPGPNSFRSVQTRFSTEPTKEDTIVTTDDQAEDMQGITHQQAITPAPDTAKPPFPGAQDAPTKFQESITDDGPVEDYSPKRATQTQLPAASLDVSPPYASSKAKSTEQGAEPPTGYQASSPETRRGSSQTQGEAALAEQQFAVSDEKSADASKPFASAERTDEDTDAATADDTILPLTTVTRQVARSTQDASDALSRDQESSPDDGQIRNLESPLIASQEASRAGRVGGDSHLSGMPAASSMEKQEAEPPAATQEPTSKGLQDSGNIESPRQASTDQTVTPAMSSAAPSVGPEGPNSSRSVQTPFSTEPTKKRTIVTAADQAEDMQTITHQQAITPASDTAKPSLPGVQDASTKFQDSITDDGPVEDYSPKPAAQTRPPAATLDVSPPYASSKAKSTGQGAEPPTGYQASSPETQLGSSQTQSEAALAEQTFPVSDEKSADASKPFVSAEPTEEDTDAAPAVQTSVPLTNVTRQVARSTPDASDALSRDQESSPDDGQIRNSESPLIASQEEASRAGRASEGSSPKEHSAIVDQKMTLPPRQAQTSSTGPDSAQIGGDSRLSGAGMPAASSLDKQEAEPRAPTQEPTSKGLQDSGNIESPRQASTDQTLTPAMSSAPPSDGPEGTEPGPNSSRSIQTPFSTEPTKEDTIVTAADQGKDMQKIIHHQAITPAPDTAKPPFPGGQDGSRKFQKSITDDGPVEDYSAAQTKPPAATLDVSPPYASSRAKSTGQGAKPPTGYQASFPETQLGSSQRQGEATPAEQKFAVSDEKSADVSKSIASAEPMEEDVDAAPDGQTRVPPTNVTRQVTRSTPDASDALSKDQESSHDDGLMKNLEGPLIASQEEASRAGRASEGSTPKEHSAIVDKKRTLPPSQAKTSSTGPDSAQIGRDARLSGAGMPPASSMEKQEAEPPAATQAPIYKGLQRQASTDQTVTPAMSSAAPSEAPQGTEPGPNSSRSVQTPFSTEPSKEDTIVTAADQAKDMQTMTHQQAIIPAPDTAKPPFPGAQDASRKFQESTSDVGYIDEPPRGSFFEPREGQTFGPYETNVDEKTSTFPSSQANISESGSDLARTLDDVVPSIGEGPAENYSPMPGARIKLPAATQDVSVDVSSKAKSTDQEGKASTGNLASPPDTKLGSSRTQGEAAPAEEKLRVSDQSGKQASVFQQLGKNRKDAPNSSEDAPGDGKALSKSEHSSRSSEESRVSEDNTQGRGTDAPSLETGRPSNRGLPANSYQNNSSQSQAEASNKSIEQSSPGISNKDNDSTRLDDSTDPTKPET